MAKWDVYGRVVASKYIGQVEAATEKEAKVKGADHPNCWASACHQCAVHFEDPEIDCITVEKVEEGL